MTADPGELERQADALESAMLEGDAPADLTKVDRLRDRARKLRFSGKAGERKAEREAEAARMAALAQLHADVLTAAADVDQEPLIRQLVAVARECSKFAELPAAHNKTVEVLIGRARELGCTVPAPGGPKAADGRVAIADGAVIASGVRLASYRESVAADALQAVLSGREPALPSVVGNREAVRRPGHLVYSPRGGAVASMDRLSPSMRDQMRKGELIEFGPDAVGRWMAGTFDLADELARHAREAAR